MADANPSLSQIDNADKSKGKGKGKPRVKNIKRSDIEKQETIDRPHEITEDTAAHTITKLRSGTVKIVRK